jgi:hypothetical protein
MNSNELDDKLIPPQTLAEIDEELQQLLDEADREPHFTDIEDWQK